MGMSEPTTRQARTAATRQRLIDVAVHQFATKPYNEVWVSEIAGQAGVAHGLMFHHFGNKRGLYLEAVREISRRLFELQPADPEALPSVQLRDVLRQPWTNSACVGCSRAVTSRSTPSSKRWFMW